MEAVVLEYLVHQEHLGGQDLMAKEAVMAFLV